MSDAEHPFDLKGCLLFFVRFLSCSSLLYILMFCAIFAAAVIAVLIYH